MNRKLLTALALVVLFTSLSMAFNIPFAEAGQGTLNLTDDTYTDKVFPISNFGGKSLMEVLSWQDYSNGGLYPSRWYCLAWMKFSLSSIPDGATVSSAKLELYANLVPETYNIGAYYISDNDWSELTLNYNSAPTAELANAPLSSTIVATGDRWYSWSVDNAIKNALSSNFKSVTIVLYSEAMHDSGQGVWFNSKETSGIRGGVPRLTVQWGKINSSPEPTQTNALSSLPYINTSLNFSISPPKGWTPLSPNSQQNWTVQFEDPENLALIQISTLETNLSLENSVSNIKNSYGKLGDTFSIISENDRLINGLTGHEIVAIYYPPNGTSLWCKNTILVDNNRVYEVSCFVLPSYWSAYAVILDKSVQTFQLNPSGQTTPVENSGNAQNSSLYLGIVFVGLALGMVAIGFVAWRQKRRGASDQKT